MKKTTEDFFGTVKDIIRLYGERVALMDIYEGIFAAYYDTLPADPEEIGIYQREAYDCGRTVLELCCGNGRITTAFAEKGFQVDGVDLSADMLELLEQKKHPELTEPPHKDNVVRLIKDVRFFLNTLNRAVGVMVDAGIGATVDRQENEDGITLTINIPHAKS